MKKAVARVAYSIENSLQRAGYYFFDSQNMLKYGPDAPLFAERLWIKPRDCEKALYGGDIKKGGKRRRSGTVIHGEWPFEEAYPVYNVKKIQYCIAHWVDGVPWYKTGIYDLMMDHIEKKGSYDGCKSFQDVEKRYQRLDRIFLDVKRKGKFKTREELDPKNFREKGGYLSISVHMDLLI
jgi:hypothetical protein